MLKTIFKSEVSPEGGIFPKIMQKPEADKQHDVLTSLVSTEVNKIASSMVKDQSFIAKIADNVKNQVLEELLNKYNFAPADKYVQEIEQKKTYINQLDVFLQDKKVIHQQVETELKSFLHDTNISITKSLESFTSSINERIKAAAEQYGIPKIQEALGLHEKG